MAITQQEATSPTAGNVAELDHLLGGEAPVEEPPSPEVEAENSGVETETEETPSEEQPTEEAGEEPSDEGESQEADEGAEDEESELSIDESDRDYSDAAYDKAAQHFARTKKVQLDPKDPTHRALLKELMDRGEAIKAFKRQDAEKSEPVKADEAPKVEDSKPQPAAAPTPQQIDEFFQSASTVAKARLIPGVAKKVAGRLVPALAKAIWPGQEFEIQDIPQEAANDLTQAFSELFWMSIEDALPVLQQNIGGYVSNEPVFAQVRQDTINASALEQLDGMTDKANGKKLYADLEEMVDSGSLKKALKENPQIANMVAGDGRNPVANQVLRYQTAYKIARGEQVNLPSLQKAVDTGKKQAETRAKKIASGRVSSGTPKGGFGKGPSADQQLVSGLVSGSESKFGAAVRQARKLR